MAKGDVVSRGMLLHGAANFILSNDQRESSFAIGGKRVTWYKAQASCTSDAYAYHGT